MVLQANSKIIPCFWGGFLQHSSHNSLPFNDRKKHKVNVRPWLPWHFQIGMLIFLQLEWYKFPLNPCSCRDTEMLTSNLVLSFYTKQDKRTLPSISPSFQRVFISIRLTPVCWIRLIAISHLLITLTLRKNAADGQLNLTYSFHSIVRNMKAKHRLKATSHI